MREFYLTQTILNKALDHLHKNPSKHAAIIHIALGEISELDPASLQTHWIEISKGTSAEHVQLHFRLIPAEVQCMACFQKYRPVNKKISCPYCGGVGAKILTGEEYYLESIESEHE
jgi:Zn finger protein HypA/HybF involved in hydrogenase expression